MSTLETAALASVAWAAAALAWSAVRAWRRTPPLAAAAPAGPAWAGIFYAFGPGMSPRAKESARRHPLIYAIGVTYHVGIFSAAASLAASIAHVTLPGRVAWSIGILAFLGALAGVELLVRRATTPLLREISALDDYASNLLADAWLLAAGLHAFWPGATPAFLIVSIALALYAPAGKIRHCVFFFLSRGLFGARLGRRGVVRPPLAGAAR